MAIQHSAIPDAELHEPKGIVAASSGQIYIANGAGSGTWTTPQAIAEYGELFISGGTSTHTLHATADTYTLLNPTGSWQTGVNNMVTMDPSLGKMTVQSTAAYNISFWAVFSTAAIASGARYKFKYAVNGTPVDRIVSTYKTTNGVDTIDTSASGLATLTSGDRIEIWVAGDSVSQGTNITVQQAGFTLHKV